MAINRKTPLFEETIEIPNLTEQGLGKLSPMEDGGGWHRWNWEPNPGTKQSPIITVNPKTGYQFVGFEIDTEWKENGSSIEKFYENRGKLNERNGSVSLQTKEIKHIVANQEQAFDWKNQLVKYTAITNKNIYDIVIKPEFCDAQGKPINGVAEISGITVDIQNTTQSDYFFKYIEGRKQIKTDITKTQMLDGSFYNQGNTNRKVLFTKAPTEWFSNEPVKVGDAQVIPANRYAALIKNNDYVLDDHFKMTAEITKVARYDFEGFYINGTKIGNHSETKSQDGLKFTYELSSVLDAAFLENPAYKINKHDNDQIVVTAKFNLGGGNFYAKWNEDEASMNVDDGVLEQGINPNPGIMG